MKLKQTLFALVAGVSIFAGSTSAFAATTSTHQIQSGDTFWKLSQQLNVSVNELMNANPTMDAMNLPIGGRLNIPGRQMTASINETGSKGSVRSHSRVIPCVATAYTGSAAENGGYAGVDYYGHPLKNGTIAVDPSVIPLGSKVYISGPGLPNGGMTAHATDIGGAIQGNRIDIFVDGKKQADTFGMQNVKVYVMK